ncbi:MAG: WecB/TagA/CpsF family glycosyltransferase [Candidatus Gracilibacteria bacterium]|nr:WecB/TagA/CpsF family glycosyltransferase [Candidatus Gracilibacteria bacterium]
MKIFDIELDALKYGDFFKEIVKFDKKNIVFTPNPEILLSLKKDKEFTQIVKKATHLVPDGIGLYIGFQIADNNYGTFVNTLLLPYFFFNLFFRRKSLYAKYGDKICGSDLTRDLIEFADKNSLGVTILDLYNPTDTKKVESQKILIPRLQEKYPNANFHLYIYRQEEFEQILKDIENSGDKIVLATLGAKRQEKLILDIFEKLDSVSVGAGIGSSIDYLIGFQKRAPKIWRALGLEWLYRLITGPQKINRLKRIYNAIFVFIYEVLKSK